MHEYFQFFSPTKIVFGIDVSKDISSEISTLGAQKVLLVSDKGIKSQDFFKEILNGLNDSDIELVGPYFDIGKDAPISKIKQLAEFGRKNKVDSIVAIGGGSVIDSAKAANILISHGGDLLNDYAGVQTISSELKPLIVIPTTAGTGSEVTSAAVVYDEEAQVKHSFVDDFLKPKIAILDPSLTLKMPAKLTSATAIDAFSHALEAYTSPMRSPVSDGLSVEALRLIKNKLIQVLEEPDNIRARSKMLTAATIAGMAFDNAMVGVIHGMAHSLGALANLHHGEAIFLAMPIGIKYNMEVAAKRYADLARRLLIVESSSNDDVACKAFLDWLDQFRKDIAKRSHLALSFKDKGIDKKILEKVATGAVNDGTSFYNPREVIAEELYQLLVAGI